ncbi:MAG: DUF1428 domain-containing protein [Planctomycetes bacterium]|nr:DUF1428 domain-containing protein [Planctomycetota bacterium]
MARYVDGFVLTVPKKKLAAYKKLALGASKIWMEHGALEYRECVGEDLASPFGVPFPKLAKAKSTDVVFFSWILYKSRKHRDQVNKRVMADKRIHEMCKPNEMPFDMKHMSMGGFEVLVEA